MHKFSAPLDGLYTDLVTPFRDGRLDRVGMMALIEWQIRCNVTGLLVCGPSGEPWSLSDEERAEIIRLTLDVVDGKVPVIVGTGTNCTRTTLELTEQARMMGAKAALLTTPFYNKPNQEGIFRHFEAIDASIELPLIVLNSPGRSAVDIGDPLMQRLCELSNVIGIVDQTGDLARRSRFPASARRRMRHYSGHDMTALAFNLIGGNGVVSVGSNVAPRLMASMFHAQRGGNVPAAMALFQRLQPLLLALDMEQPVVAAKLALASLLGLSPETRLPLVPLSDTAAQAMADVLAMLGDGHRPEAA